ncbi:M6 metalloprotease [Delitschia confertaspora ATCC 74209]|uniref:M6 metalloprotease n=1 Tax=Delitschia confertaspora ATCC 74209 TaxID=1513339 RepID=A0A9P4MRT8_9PLEO|nr:M6 metalloprotease [Delitschia confertaspora ATCC 74209]
MTWDDYKAPPSTSWADPTRKGSERNFNIALVTVDYPDQPFVVTLPPHSDIFSNPQPLAAGMNREDVPSFYRDLLNKPSELNRQHTLHEYWMEDSRGKYGVDLTVFGAYQMPGKSWQYGIDDEEDGMNPGACPGPEPCSVDLRTDALGAWRADVGNETASKFELVFILSAGQDESSTWQEFGEMKFATPADVPEEFGPPSNMTLPNWAKTRYVNWTSWASASTIWPNAGRGSSTQGESSGMATFAHELSHLLGISDNYNNPFGDPPRRSYTGPWSMLSRGSFNGPGGPHTRWQIPPVQGGSMGSLHTMRDKHQINLTTENQILQVSRSGLVESGLLVAKITARSVDAGSNGLMGLNISFGQTGDLSPHCDVQADALCDGGSYHNYNMEVVDRMGADSFCPDSGVLISKTKNTDRSSPFQWVIDANPQDIRVIDFFLPNGTARYLTIGDYRQLADALFHAGTRSGSKFEHVDEANRLHLYVLDIERDGQGVLHYVVGVRSLDGSDGPHKHGVKIQNVKISKADHKAALATFTLKNTGKLAKSKSKTGVDAKYLNSDIFRLKAEVVEGKGWKVALPNELAVAQYGKETTVNLAVGADGKGASQRATIKVTATSESNPSVSDIIFYKANVKW